MNFIKYHIAGKDYIYCSKKTDFDNLTKTDVITLCDRHKGVGADGIFIFCKSSSKTAFLQGFSSSGECVHNFSSASICACFEAFSATVADKYTFSAENGQKYTVKTSPSEGTPLFFSTLTADPDEGIFGQSSRKTEIGNRILTVTPISLHGIYAVHFTDCPENLNLSYLGSHISRNSLFGKQANMILAKPTGRNSLDISFYENKTGCPRPEVSAFAAAALAACRNGTSNYGEYISVTCNGNTIAVICHAPDTVTIKCSCEKVFEGNFLL